MRHDEQNAISTWKVLSFLYLLVVVHFLSTVGTRQALVFSSIFSIYIYFFQVLLTKDRHFTSSSKIFCRGRCDSHFIFNIRFAIWRQFVRSCHDCLQCEITVWSPKTFESSNRGSIISLQLNRTRDLTNHGITGPNCISLVADKMITFCLHFQTETLLISFCTHLCTLLMVYIQNYIQPWSMCVHVWYYREYEIWHVLMLRNCIP